MTRPRSFPYHGLIDVEVGMSCPGTRGGMGSVPRSAVAPNRAWYSNNATRYQMFALALGGIVSMKDGPRLPTKTSSRNCTPPHPTPLRKHLESQENELDKAVLVRNEWYHNMSLGTYVTENLPIPHPKHNCCNRHTVQTNFSKFWRSSLPIRGIRSCGIETLPNLAPHLEQLHMLANWGRLRSRLGFRFWNGVGFLFLGTRLSSAISLVK